MEPLTREDEGLQDSFEAIGADLSSSRLDRGMQVSEVAQLLRISRHYIKNIEAGELDLLPGPTYVSGYLRSYARAVGLDQDELPRRYRALIDGKAARPQYEFPIDNQRPQRSGAMMASILVMFAVAGYGGWYAAGKPDLLNALTGDDAPSVITVPQVETAVIEPDNLITPETQPQLAVAEPDAISTAMVAGNAADGVSPAVMPAGDDSSVAASGNSDPGPLTTGMGETGLAGSEAGSPAAISTTTVSSSDDGELAQSGVTDEAPALATATGSGLETTGADMTTVAETDLTSLPNADASQAQMDAVQPVAEDAAGSSGVAFAMQRVPELEITVRATGTSWVEIIRNDGEEVMTQLMRKGETYIVDSRDKLYLSTGNAGGLELLFHDGTVRPVGVSGEILRDLPLDAERLRNQL